MNCIKCFQQILLTLIYCFSSLGRAEHLLVNMLKQSAGDSESVRQVRTFKKQILRLDAIHHHLSHTQFSHMMKFSPKVEIIYHYRWEKVNSFKFRWNIFNLRAKLFIICFDFRWPSSIRREQDFITKLFTLSGNFSPILLIYF